MLHYRFATRAKIAMTAVLSALVIFACASPEGPTAIVVPPTEEFGGPPFSAVVISSDLAIGDNRFSFGVINRDGMPIRVPEARLRVYFLPEGDDGRQSKSSATASFQKWTTSAAGIYTANLFFDTVGTWEIEADLTAAGTAITAGAMFTVKETSDTPSIGAPAPASVTPTAADVPDLSHISSDPDPDPGYYQISVHQALDQGLPFVVVFSTPKFCTSATCGPQLQALRELKDRYAGRAAFIHVEVFKDPHLIEEERPGLEQAVSAVNEWGLPNEPWTFVVDSEGRVAAKYQQFTPASVVEAALADAVGQR